MPEYRGECLCAAARYLITADAPPATFLCHCSRCRKESGSAHAANAFFAAAKLEWTRGGTELSRFALAGTRKQRVFCTICGSPLPRPTAEGGVVLPLGSLDAGCEIEPSAHIFWASRAAWEAGLADAPRFDELPS